MILASGNSPSSFDPTPTSGAIDKAQGIAETIMQGADDVATGASEVAGFVSTRPEWRLFLADNWIWFAFLIILILLIVVIKWVSK